MKRPLRAGKRSNRAGPLLALAEPPFTVCFRCVERVIRGLLETRRALRPSWTPPTIKAVEAGGPLTGNYHQKSKLTAVATWAVTSATPSQVQIFSPLFTVYKGQRRFEGPVWSFPHPPAVELMFLYLYTQFWAYLCTCTLLLLLANVNSQHNTATHISVLWMHTV